MAGLEVCEEGLQRVLIDATDVGRVADFHDWGSLDADMRDRRTESLRRLSAILAQD